MFYFDIMMQIHANNSSVDNKFTMMMSEIISLSLFMLKIVIGYKNTNSTVVTNRCLCCDKDITFVLLQKKSTLRIRPSFNGFGTFDIYFQLL